MEYKIFLTVLLITCETTVSIFHKDNDYYDHTQSEEYYDSSSDNEQSLNDEERASTLADQTVTTQPQYEVTEIIDDIPNTGNVLSPVVTNFTLTKPLNHATNNTVISNVTSAIDYQSNNKFTNSKETINKPKNNYISIFHVKAEFDNNKQGTGPAPNIHIHKYPHFIGFRDYIHGVRKGIESGINSFIHKDKYFSLNGMAGPALFFNKLNNKRSDVATNVHRAIFGHQF